MAPTVQAPLFSFISDQSLALLLPIIVYWVYSLAFHWISVKEFSWFEKYRIHDKEEETRNRVSLPEVIKAVIIQQLLQVSIIFSNRKRPRRRRHHMCVPQTLGQQPNWQSPTHTTADNLLGVSFLSFPFPLHLKPPRHSSQIVTKHTGTNEGRQRERAWGLKKGADEREREIAELDGRRRASWVGRPLSMSLWMGFVRLVLIRGNSKEKMPKSTSPRCGTVSICLVSTIGKNVLLVIGRCVLLRQRPKRQWDTVAQE